MTWDTDRRDEGLAHLRKTSARYTPKLEASPTTEWGKAFAAFAQIGHEPAAPPAPPAHPFADFVGVCAYRDVDASLVAGLGVRHARMDNPSAAELTQWRAAGVEVLPLATYCPWPDLNGGQDDKHPPTPANHAAWATRVVDRYRSMGNPPAVLEFWNEPWLTNFWEPGPDAPAYLALFKAFSAAVWAWRPETVILVSLDTSGSGGYAWRKNLLAADTTKALCDPRVKWTTHNYVEGRGPTTVTPSPCSWDLDRYRCASVDALAHGMGRTGWVTEFGWTRLATDTPPGVGEATQADYIEQALHIFKDSGLVERAYLFCAKSNDPWSYDVIDGNRLTAAALTLRGILTT
jgi:hypothetical protein